MKAFRIGAPPGSVGGLRGSAAGIAARWKRRSGSRSWRWRTSMWASPCSCGPDLLHSASLPETPHRANGFDLVAAYNEAHAIAAKIRNALDLDYPADKLEIAIASDGSRDANRGNRAAIHPAIRAYGSSNTPFNRGKINRLERDRAAPRRRDRRLHRRHQYAGPRRSARAGGELRGPLRGGRQWSV